MPEYRSLDPSFSKIFESVISQVATKLLVKRRSLDVGLKLLSRFEELRRYRDVYVHNVTEFKSDAGAFIILLVEKHLTIVEYRRHGRREKEIEEVEPVLIFSVPADMGKVFIRKETISDKIADVFNKVDIDFVEYPRFSKEYFVVAEKPDVVREHIPHRLLSTLEAIPGMTIEINGNWGLLRAEKNLTEELMLLLISIGYKMTRKNS